MAPCSLAVVRSMQFPSRDTDLMSQRSQRKSASTIAVAPDATSAAEGVTSSSAIMNTVGTSPRGKTWLRGATPRVTCR
jgi:hypothetical protein